MEPIKTVWHDPHIFNEENQRYAREYLSSWENRCFISVSEAVQFLTATNNRWILITSGANGESLVKQVHDLPTVVGIVVFCRDYHNHRQWSSAFSKVKSVETFSFENVVKEAVACWNQLVTLNDLCVPRISLN